MIVQDVKQISIRLLPDGFSYLNQFHPILPGADFNQRLEEAMLEAISDSADSETVEGVCMVESVRFFISPLEIDESMAEKMARMTTPEIDQEEITIQLKDDSLGIRFSLYIDSHLYHFLQRNWPEITFSHPLFRLIQQWAGSEQVKEDCMVAEAGENYLNLTVYKQGRLHLANRFEVSGTDNILYHIMNCWTQCELDVIEDKLFLTTEIDNIRQQIGQYIKQCES